jgi:hypothetical protein
MRWAAEDVGLAGTSKLHPDPTHPGIHTTLRVCYRYPARAYRSHVAMRGMATTGSAT